MPSPLFSARHYTWLANFAARHLTAQQRTQLLLQLELDNPKFDHVKFSRAVLSNPREARPDEALNDEPNININAVS